MALPQQRQDRIEGIAEGAVRTTPPVIAPGHTFQSVTDRISSIILTKRTRDMLYVWAHVRPSGELEGGARRARCSR